MAPFCFQSLTLRPVKSNPAVMVQLREEATGTSSFSTTVKSLTIMSEGAAEKCEYLHQYNTGGQ
jgi:hypothetical protein